MHTPRSYSFCGRFSLQSNHANTINPFTAVAIHNAPSNPTELFVRAPPTVAPTKSITALMNLLLRSGSSNNPAVSRCGSLIKSQYRLVKTTVGMALYFSTRLATTCPALWKASSAIGHSSIHSKVPRSPSFPGRAVFSLETTPEEMRAVVTIIKTVCRRNDDMTTHRLSGPR